MKKEIKFRGKDCSGQWVYGDLIHKRHDKESVLIQDYTGLGSDVDTITIGQYTGLKDKNGKEIYEGDIIVEKLKRARKIGERLVVCFEEFEWRGKNVNEAGTSLSLLSEYHIIEVIGNIHDNPEFFK